MPVISQTSEYALRAMVWLTTDSKRPQSAQQIADVIKVTPGHLVKIMQPLSHAGLVSSRRGPNGGFTLAKPPDSISLLNVINAVDPVQRIHSCPLDISSHGGRLCPLHRRLDDAIAAFEAHFAKTSLRDVVTERASSRPLCEPFGQVEGDLACSSHLG